MNPCPGEVPTDDRCTINGTLHLVLARVVWQAGAGQCADAACDHPCEVRAIAPPPRRLASVSLPVGCRGRGTAALGRPPVATGSGPWRCEVALDAVASLLEAGHQAGRCREQVQAKHRGSTNEQ